MDPSGIMKESFPQTHEQEIYTYFCKPLIMGGDNIIVAIAGELNLEFISFLLQPEVKDSCEWLLKSSLLDRN